MIHQSFIHTSRRRNDLARSRFDYRPKYVHLVAIVGERARTLLAVILGHNEPIAQGCDCFLGSVLKDNSERCFFRVESEMPQWRRFRKVLEERTESWEGYFIVLGD